MSNIRIEALGHLGDGIGEANGESVHVPMSLPGEMVRISGNGPRRQLEAIVEPSRDRIEPVCAHFGQCGGCQMQHMAQAAYLDWKRSLLRGTLMRAGIDHEPEAIRHYPLSSRRRAILSARLVGGKWLLGYQAKASHQIIDIETCPILAAPLQAAIEPLRGLLRLMGGHGAGTKHGLRVTLLAAGNGIDLAFEFKERANDRLVRDTARNVAAQHFLRIAFNGETVVERERPVLEAGLALVTPPPGAFVQAVAAAETDMAALALHHLSGCKRVADLFCGHGAFALRLAGTASVFATDSEAPALAALERAWRETGGRLKQITAEKRDLFRRPVMAQELNRFDGALFDPPRAGAEAQARELAASGVGRIVAVSCNPQTLARDLAILMAGGYHVVSITPIDQFAFTPHLEAVALLERRKAG